MTRPSAPAPRLAALALALTLGPVGARADVFSPGPLAGPHAYLEGLASCTKCHAAGEQLSPEHCLACHVELKWRVEAGRGFHGRLKPAERTCQTCHHEHQGADFKLIDWGPGGQKGFDHARTGWPLEGKHRRADCARCHDVRLIQDPGLRPAIEKKRETRLGAPTSCAACHFDEHRGQLGAECQRCHAADAWKPARGFDHARAAYKLEGKHVRVACAKCHSTTATTVPTGVAPRTPPVRPSEVVRYRPVPFAACTDCHKDPHQGRFGAACTACHTTADWKQIIGLSKERAFHEKTRYPLRGAHAAVKCDACHLVQAGARPVYRGIPFERCTDCHLDAHLGQLAVQPAQGTGPVARTCDRCHGMEGYQPARFEAEDHEKLAYKLEGAHRAVACAACHPKDARLEARLPAAARARLEKAGRPIKLALALYRIPRATDCRTCHRDPHGGQFQPRVEKEGCTGCHRVEGWKPARLDHAKETRFPLTGKHEKAACASCHRPGDGGIVRYRPLPLACAGCHPDPHVGQLAAANGTTDCARCHESGDWKKPLRFDHQRDSRFKLEGKHKPLGCEKCHPVVTVAGAAVRRYRPLPLDCQGCHADFHQGAFKGFKP